MCDRRIYIYVYVVIFMEAAIWYTKFNFIDGVEHKVRNCIGIANWSGKVVAATEYNIWSGFL